MPWMAIGSTSVLPMVKRGFSEAYGFWKTTWMRRRTGSISRAVSVSRSRPSNSTRPASGPPVGSCSRSSVRPIVVLPEPDSPTTPSVWPRRSVKLAAFTALELAAAEDALCAARSPWQRSRPRAPPAPSGSFGLPVPPAALGQVVSSMTSSRARCCCSAGRQASSALRVGVLRRGEDAGHRAAARAPCPGASPPPGRRSRPPRRGRG